MVVLMYMNVDIISDTICPWCFVGKRRFERALAERPDIQIDVRWRTFQLNPDMPADGHRPERVRSFESSAAKSRPGRFTRTFAAPASSKGFPSILPPYRGRPIRSIHID